MKKTIVLLRVRDDYDEREWWEALGLPNPVYWPVEETFDNRDIFAEVIYEQEVKL